MRGVLLDTDPLVALINASDPFHAWARSAIQHFEWPLLTCDSVVTEAFFLLRRTTASPDTLWQMIARGAIRPAFRLEDQHESVAALLKRYANVPMSVADACLVRMSELAEDNEGTVFTLDSDFRVYRRHRRRKIPVLMPPGR